MKNIKSRKLSLAATLFAILNSGMVYSADSAAPDERGEAPRIAPLGDHNYLEVAYNVSAYEGIADREQLFRIYRDNELPSMKDRAMPLSCFIEDDWKITCDILQLCHLRQMTIPGLIKESTVADILDDAFTFKNFGVNTIKGGGWQDHEPLSELPNLLLYLWKQVAWIDADQADQLSQALREGFKDLIPIRPQWAAYWHQRAKLLRAQPQWYKPIDTYK